MRHAHTKPFVAPTRRPLTDADADELQLAVG
jgi:hypothetical protein